MGRSGGRKLASKRGGISRQQLRLFDVEDADVSSDTSNATGYSPGTDHEQLLSDAAHLWSDNPANLMDIETAQKRWREFLAPDPAIDRDNSEYWERVLEALAYQAQTETVTGPLFRGQPFISEHPLDRERGWSQDISSAIQFLVDKGLAIENDQGTSRVELFLIKSQARLAVDGKGPSPLQGGELVAAFYVLENPENGFSLNGDSLRNQRNKEVFDAFKNGLVGKSYFGRDPVAGDWRVLEAFNNFDQAKEEAVETILDEMDFELLGRETGLDEKYPDRDSLFAEMFYNADLVKIEKLLEQSGNKEKLEEWRETIQEIEIEMSFETEMYRADECYLEENEVIVSPGSADSARRVEIVLADSDEELADLTADKIREKVTEALENEPGSSVTSAPASQKTLFRYR